jgi:hypothetical protein
MTNTYLAPTAISSSGAGPNWSTPTAIIGIKAGDVKRTTATATSIANQWTASDILFASNFNLLVEDGGFIPLNAILTSVTFECRGIVSGQTNIIGNTSGILNFLVTINGVGNTAGKSIIKAGAGDGPWTTVKLEYLGTSDNPQVLIFREWLKNGTLLLRAQLTGSDGITNETTTGSIAYFRVTVNYRLDE